MTPILVECVAEALAKGVLRPDQGCKVETVQGRDGQSKSWKAVRLTTEGGNHYPFRKLAKAKINQVNEDRLTSRQPYGVNLYREAPVLPALYEKTLGEFVETVKK